MTATQEQEILNLRALNLTPKQIARKLGVKVSEVSSVIQNQAQQIFHPFPGEPHPVPLEVAQGMIFSACEYAESLGFKPHKDFEKSRSAQPCG
ncbi:helix-turn-helix transcriptional regulator [Plectonema radiosum]|uniref:helix-turn-helix transcriptional regulator n=1 Tax=Plectonema radiosum TaxID=945768 RepID=UPI001D14B9BD|nr:hypothetical protein [Plectonema radiosum]